MEKFKAFNSVKRIILLKVNPVNLLKLCKTRDK